MNPYLSWAIVLVVAGGLGWYYTDGSKPKGRTAVRTTTEKTESSLSAPKQKKKARKAPESAPAPARKPGEKKPEEKQSWQSAPLDTAHEEDVDNKEFAKRFAAVKNGVAITDSSKNRSKEKRAKKAVAAANQPESGSSERSGSHVSTRTSSTGADADDDLSSAGAPVAKATVPSADDVSDMLEPPAPGASVLRLTGSMESEAKKPKPQKFKQVESKKQRQQRLKNEARKQQVQEAEEQRRKLLEKQLHTAREAERREAARKQPAASPAPNAWKTTTPVDNTSNGAPKAPVNHNAPLLDTFDPEKPATSSTAERQAESSSAGTWAQGLPPEEEQMRILGVTNHEDDWTTVSSKKGKKKGAKAEESVSDASASEPPAPPEVVAPKVTPIPIPDTRGKGHPLDSDWAA